MFLLPRPPALVPLGPFFVLAASVAGCCGASSTEQTTQRATNTSEPAQPRASEGASTRVLAENTPLRLVLPTPDLYREANDGFSVRLRVLNTSSREQYLDLASPTRVGPTHVGPLTTPERRIVDERRLPDEPLDDAGRERLWRARAEGSLTRLGAGESLDLYAPFHGREAAMFAVFATPWVFVSLDGYLDAIDSNGEVTRLSLAWNETRTRRDTDIVHPMPMALEERTCRRERRVLPRSGSTEWPLVVCVPSEH
jgi:hypothetical protein